MALGDSTLTLNDSGFDADNLPEDVEVSNPSAGVFQITSDGPIVDLGIGDDPDQPISSSFSILTDSEVAVDNFQADLGGGNDRLLIGGGVINSSIEIGDGSDNFVVNGDFTNSGVDTGADRDVLRFDGNVEGSYINSGSGDDLVGFMSGVNGSVVELGTGNDEVRFYGDVTNTRLDLGGGADVVRIFDPNADTTGLVIEGASDDDVLFIGSAEYKYDGGNTWINVDDPNAQRLF